MVYLYYCSACEDGDHARCEIGHPAPPGVYGGSKCRCSCNGDPLWNSPERVHQQTMDFLKKWEEIQENSRRALKNDKRRAKNVTQEVRPKKSSKRHR
jgi:hypothetical protein